MNIEMEESLKDVSSSLKDFDKAVTDYQKDKKYKWWSWGIQFIILALSPVLWLYGSKIYAVAAFLIGFPFLEEWIRLYKDIKSFRIGGV